MNKLLSFIPFSLESVKSFLVGFLIALVLGVAGGYWVKSRFVKADQVDAAQVERKQSQASVEEGNKGEQKVLDQTAKIDTKFKVITKEVVKYVPQTVTESCKTEDGTAVATTLNAAAVSVLNSGAESPDVQPASISDAEVQTPTEVGLQEMSDYIVELQKQYHELAAFHDTLVDYDNWYKSQVNK